VSGWRHPLSIAPDDEDYVTGLWKRTYAEMLLPAEFLSMLRNKAGGFFQEDLRAVLGQWPLVREHYTDAEIDAYTAEPPVVAGGSTQLIVQMTTIHHLYCLALWETTTGTDLRDLAAVVEWGGGFGSFARLALRRNPDLVYRIVDLPVMSALQQRYLDSAGLADANVSFMGPTASNGLKADLFVAMWSLDESPERAQRIAVNNAWYGADHVLIAFHPDKEDFEDSFDFAARVVPSTAAVFPAPHTPGSFYATR
jgi:hypothetical protein